MDNIIARALALASALAGLGTVVVATGGAVAWVRHSVAQLPADQAVAVMPERELVTLGAVSLSGFAIAAAFAVLVVFAIDHCGRPVPQSRVGLALLLAAGLIAAVWVDFERPDGPDEPLGAGPAVRATAAVLLVLALMVVVSLRFQRKEKKIDGVPQPEAPHVITQSLLYLALAAGLALWVEPWIGALALVGGLIAGAVLVVSWQSGTTFRWYGVSVFVGVMLFGAALSILHAVADTKVQAAAVLFTPDAGGGGLAGVHVAETDDRIYLGVVERRCVRDPHTQLLRPTRAARPRAGRIVEIRRSDVASLAVGPLQSIVRADDRGRELLDDLQARIARRPGASAAAQQGPCRGQGVADLSARESTPVTGAAARALAQRHRPLLRFDTRERWRPLNVGTLFAERRGGRPAHRLCEAAGGCTPLDGAADLEAAVLDVTAPGGHVDFDGRANRGEEHRTPRLNRCPAQPSPLLLDCDQGSASAIYYNVTEANGRVYLDYWWFLRFNRFDRLDRTLTAACRGRVACLDHEGDWEGVTVVTAPRRSDLIQYVGMASHAHVFRFTADQVVRGGRPVVFVARGSHASYPDSCTKCWQPGGLPEASTDGTVPWGRNDDSACFRAGEEPCLIELPAADRPGSWNAYPGRWGSRECAGGDCRFGHGPKSPGAQRRYLRPWCFTTTASMVSTLVKGTRESCDAEATDAGAGAQPGVPTATDCDAWLGGSVAAVVCDPRVLADTLGSDEARAAGGLKVTAGEASGSTGAVPGVAQAVGPPLPSGGRAVVEGRASADAVLVVRLLTEGEQRQARFRDLGLEDGGTATVTIEGERATLRRPDGKQTVVVGTPLPGVPANS